MLRALWRLLVLPDKRAMLQLVSGMQDQTRLEVAALLLRLGFWPRLREASRLEELAECGAIRELELLRSLLALGTKAGLLRRRGEAWRARAFVRISAARACSAEDAALWLRKQVRSGRLYCTAELLRRGVLPLLSTSKCASEVAQACGQGVDAEWLLESGVRARALRRRGDRFSPRGPLARCVARDPEGPIASMLLEFTSYHLEVFENLPARLRGEPRRDYLAQYGRLVARSSRIMAPWICGFSASALRRDRAQSILELGCGAGDYLLFYAERHAGHRGVGIDLDRGVVQDAQRRVEAAGLGERFSIRAGDLREESAWPEERFDVITAHQNVYYFTPEERATLWGRCRERLREGGRLVIVTPTAGGPMSDYFSLILGSTQGCCELPSAELLAEEFVAAGFRVERRERLIPGDSVWGFRLVVDARA